MPSAEYIETASALQYTGSNGAEMSAFANTPIVSESGGVLELGNPETMEVSTTFQTGDWYDKRYNSRSPAAIFPAMHISKAAALLDTNTVFDPTSLQTQVTANTTAITNLNASQATQDTAIAAAAAAAAGKLGKADIVSISVPILLLGGTADRPITWNRAFSNANYDLSYAFDASTIGRITCAPVAGTKTTTGITIRITAGLAVSVLGVVHVFAIGA